MTSATLSGMTFGPSSFAVEYLLRKNRQQHLTDEQRRLTFRGENTMEGLGFLATRRLQYLYLEEQKKTKIIERLQEIEPAYLHGCDHHLL